ncbi:sulfatase family protein [Coraliomargarita parva]|uniref:sulfatase family protein n=1 Tax=Coraliomargarita parva TaxID=3014050 RepID=UPI0022B4AA92|nr:sulfatase [Coraliomargarita parva]
MNPLNIVYLHSHDAGRYIQPYGYAIQTPQLQKFAEQGMLFRQAFCENPTCSPSRACLMTGQSAHVNGMLGLAHRGFRLNHYEDTLVNYLRGHGWHTALSGVQHIAHEPFSTVEEIGYHEVLDEALDDSGTVRRYAPDSSGVADAATDFLAREHDKPFFLDVGFFPPHRIDDGDFPSSLPVPNPAYVRPPAHLPDTPETREDFARYMASVSTFDALAGQVLDAIDRNGLSGNTLVIVTTDHGIAFPGMKCRLTDHGLGVLLILRGPGAGGFEQGKVTDAMVSHLDIFPTVCESLGLPLPERLEGESLAALANDPEAELRDCLFAEVNVHAAPEPMRAVRTPRWKYIRHYQSLEHRVLPNCDDSPSKTRLCESGWAAVPSVREELYDLVLDPIEGNNLAALPQHADTLAEMAGRLDDWMAATSDPLLDGALELDGKILTPVDAYSPKDINKA